MKKYIIHISLLCSFVLFAEDHNQQNSTIAQELKSRAQEAEAKLLDAQRKFLDAQQECDHANQSYDENLQYLKTVRGRFQKFSQILQLKIESLEHHNSALVSPFGGVLVGLAGGGMRGCFEKNTGYPMVNLIIRRNHIISGGLIGGGIGCCASLVFAGLATYKHYQAKKMLDNLNKK